MKGKIYANILNFALVTMVLNRKLKNTKKKHKKEKKNLFYFRTFQGTSFLLLEQGFLKFHFAAGPTNQVASPASKV